MSRKLVYILIGILVLIVVVAIALPLLVDANQFRPRVESEASKALGRDVKIGNLKLSLFAGGVRADNLEIAENPRFGKSPFLTAQSMTIGVDILPLITSKKLNINSFTISDPKVNLVEDSNGKWNVSTLGGKGGTSQQGSTGEFSVGKFNLSNGTLTVIHRAAEAKPSVYSKVELTAKDVSLNSKFPFTFSAVPPGGGSINVEGDFGPLAQGDTAGTPLAATITVKNFDLAQSGAIEPSSGIRGIVDLKANVKSDGKVAKLDATGTGTRLALVPAGTAAKVPVGLDLAADYSLQKQTGALTKGVVKIGNSPANIAGTFDMSGTTTKANMKVDANNLAIGDVEGILPAIGVILPSGANLQGGTATAHATSVGPMNALVTTGSVKVENTKLTGFDLGSKMSAVAKLAGITSSSETPIQQFSTDLRMAPAGMQADNIKLIAPTIGVLSGAGTISPRNELNFKMSAELQGSNNAIGALAQVAGVKQNKATIPFKITGTTANPVFLPDVGGTLGGMVSGGGQSQGAGGILGNLGGLFGKKKK